MWFFSIFFLKYFIDSKSYLKESKQNSLIVFENVSNCTLIKLKMICKHENVNIYYCYIWF